MLSIKDLAQELNVSDKTVRRKIKELNITPIQIDKRNGKKFYSENSLEEIKSAFIEALDTLDNSNMDTAGQGLDTSKIVQATAKAEQEKTRLDSIDNDGTEVRQRLDNSNETAILSLLEKDLAFYKAQLEEKDKQIANLNDLLSKSNDLLSQEQKLNLINQKQIDDLRNQLLLTAPKEDSIPEKEILSSNDADIINNKPEEKKSFWKRLFNR